MIEEKALVVKIEGEYAWIETQRQSSCGHCSVKEGCGTQVLGKFLANKSASVRCVNSLNVKVGEMVVIGIAESALVKGSLLLYFLPIISMILFGGIAVMFSQIPSLGLSSFTDLFAVIASFGGLFAGLFFSKYFVKKSTSKIQLEPVILKKLSLFTNTSIKHSNET